MNNVPDGWKLVPICPTREMRAAAGREESKYVAARATFFAGDSWAPMVEAAPEYIAEAWGGEGMPPIGIEIEVVWNDRPSIFKRAFVVAHDEGRVVYRWLEGDKAGSYQADALRDPKYCPANPMFRPVRTPEQIAAEERETELNRMVATVSMLGQGLGAQGVRRSIRRRLPQTRNHRRAKIMIAYLRRELERCLMDRAFRNLHEKIDDLNRQIKQLSAAKDRVLINLKQQEDDLKQKIDNAITDRNAAESELDRQIGINRVIKTKRHIESQRQKTVINQLRDFMTPEQFVKICESVNALPDSDFIAEDFRP